MKSFAKLLFLFLLFVFPWDAMGQQGVSSAYQAAIIEAESSRTASLHSGQISPTATQQKPKKDVNRSNRSYLLDTVTDSRNDISESIFIESFFQCHVSIFINGLSTIEHGIPTDKLIFPFHFFL